MISWERPCVLALTSFREDNTTSANMSHDLPSHDLPRLLAELEEFGIRSGTVVKLLRRQGFRVVPSTIFRIRNGSDPAHSLGKAIERLHALMLGPMTKQASQPAVPRADSTL